MPYLLFILGFIILIKASDYFVDAGTKIAEHFKVPEIIIGATIISIGTTLPETMVSATSAFKGAGDIAFGNAVGSIFCNTALISALTMIFTSSSVKRKDIFIPTIFLFSTFIFYFIYAIVFKRLDRMSGTILILAFILYVVFLAQGHRLSDKQIEEHIEEHFNEPKREREKKQINIKNQIFILMITAAAIAIASNLLVDNGIIIARQIGISEEVIGITVIALGTSLPELATAITAIVKKHANLSIGNIIGADFLNVTLVAGISSVISPYNIPSIKSLYIDIPIAMLAITILCIPTLISQKTRKWQGYALIMLYIGFIIYQFIH